MSMDAARSKYWDRMVDIIDENFPKGECKERGKALVALAYIEMMIKENDKTLVGCSRDYCVNCGGKNIHI